MSDPAVVDRFSEALQEWPADALVSERLRLENSLKHLKRSNDELGTAAQDAGDEDKKMYKECIDENIDLIAKQQERIKAIESRLEEMTGVNVEQLREDAYKMVQTEADATPNANTATTSNRLEELEEQTDGVHL